MGGGTKMRSSTARLDLLCDFSMGEKRLAESPYKYLNNNFLHVEPEQEMASKTAKYRILAKLGFGGFSTVWLARCLNAPSKGDAWYAIKIMAANLGDAAEELKSIETVRKCGVSIAGFRAVTDTWEEVRGNNKYLCIPMKFSGPTVMECLKWKPKLEQRLTIAFHALEIIKKLHEKNETIIDFTSANLLVKLGEPVKRFSETEMYEFIKPQMKYAKVEQEVVDQNGNVKRISPPEPVPRRLWAKISLIRLIDDNFPLDVIDVHQDPVKLTITANYASPAVLLKKKAEKSDFRSNIWSLGVLLCEILTGSYPFDGDTFEALHKSHEDFFDMDINKQKDYLACYSEQAADRLGKYIYNEYQQDCIAELLFQIFTSHGNVPLNGIEEMLYKIKSGKKPAAETTVKFKRPDSLLDEDFQAMKIGPTSQQARPSSKSRLPITTVKPQNTTRARTSPRPPGKSKESKNSSGSVVKPISEHKGNSKRSGSRSRRNHQNSNLENQG